MVKGESPFFLKFAKKIISITFFLIITDLGEPCEYALTITENRRVIWASAALCGF